MDIRYSVPATIVDCLVNADASTLVAVLSSPPYSDTFTSDAAVRTLARGLGLSPLLVSHFRFVVAGVSVVVVVAVAVVVVVVVAVIVVVIVVVVVVGIVVVGGLCACATLHPLAGKMKACLNE